MCSHALCRCGPCRQFTPVLSKVYQEVRAGKHAEKFEVVFCSADHSEAEFMSYFKSMAPWLAVDYEVRERGSEGGREGVMVDGQVTEVLCADNAFLTVGSEQKHTLLATIPACTLYYSLNSHTSLHLFISVHIPTSINLG